MKKVITLAVAVAFSFASCSEGGNAAAKITKDDVAKVEAKKEMAAKVPVMTFETKEFNFGTIKQGEVVEYDFKFKNTGESDLVIVKMKGSCGCTVPKWDKTPVKPGESATFHVKFNSAGKRNKQNKTVTITCNTATGKEVVYVKGDVIAPPKPATKPVVKK